jgi:hypothetical protein
VLTGGSYLELPYYVGDRAETVPHGFGEPEFSSPVPADIVSTSPTHWRHSHDVSSGRHDLQIRLAPLAADGASGRIKLLDSDLEIEELQDDLYSILEGDPLSARVECNRSCHLARGDWAVDVVVRSSMTADTTTFHLTHLLEASVQGVNVFVRSWHRAITRDCL